MSYKPQKSSGSIKDKSGSFDLVTPDTLSPTAYTMQHVMQDANGKALPKYSAFIHYTDNQGHLQYEFLNAKSKSFNLLKSSKELLEKKFGPDAALVNPTKEFPELDTKISILRKEQWLQKNANKNPTLTHKENMQALEQQITNKKLQFHTVDSRNQLMNTLIANDELTIVQDKKGKDQVVIDNYAKSLSTEEGVLTYHDGSQIQSADYTPLAVSAPNIKMLNPGIKLSEGEALVSSDDELSSSEKENNSVQLKSINALSEDYAPSHYPTSLDEQTKLLADSIAQEASESLDDLNTPSQTTAVENTQSTEYELDTSGIQLVGEVEEQNLQAPTAGDKQASQNTGLSQI